MKSRVSGVVEVFIAEEENTENDQPVSLDCNRFRRRFRKSVQQARPARIPHAQAGSGRA